MQKSSVDAYEFLIPMKEWVSISRRPTRTAKAVTPLEEREIEERAE
jgi:hypothetical protein